jgi:predicted site-specific integrase-resolvase
MKHIKLSQWARDHSYTYRGAWGLFKRGGIEGAMELPSGAIMVPVPEKPRVEKEEHTVVYARVSSSENKDNLNSQADRVSSFCMAKGWKIKEVIKECASGLNDKRPKLTKVLKERVATRIVVEHKDRLTRFGYNFIETLYPECEIVVINEVADDKADLMQDFVSLVTSFCARLYGHRRNKRKTEEIINSLVSDDKPGDEAKE